MDTAKAISSISSWSTLPLQLQQALCQIGRIREEKAENIVFHQGSYVDVIVWTLRGHLFTRAQQENGNQILLTHIPVGRLILFDYAWKNRALDRDFIALTDVELLILPRGSVSQLLASYDEFKIMIIDCLADRLNDLDKVLYTHKVASREASLASFLVDCEEGQSGIKKERHIPLTMQFMADCLRLSRPYVAKTLKRFENQHLVCLNYGYIEILDIGGLRDIANR
ncbi:Crp/Fnr family transcriptional regulator [Citrobacter sp. Cb004]|uniref:Crp/Fnr family transcriptional regulator n=1 Tax=Citrobacter sp. Cb004 TaxID=2985006 RepID=UPI002577649C|nr:Crp/Fnr family transcriptional regulator [Citrobacter sp. Cb004]MDM3357006.1 Crp/Fnr family transcriptional regulator [Citrobacter sp. Cb004]